MSISPSNTSRDDSDFVDIEFRPTPRRETTDVTQVEAEAKSEDDTTENTTSAKNEEQKASGWVTITFDSLLVVLLLLVIGFGGYYLKQQLDRYRVPTAMEIALEENTQLSQKRESLQSAFYQADEQIQMRRALATLTARRDALGEEIAQLENSISQQKDIILALQHEIRQADTDARHVAYSLLPGMFIGTASTTTGKSIPGAVIYRLDRNDIHLRYDAGQVRVRIKDLVKDSLPPMARYAFGLDDLVNMSDFETRTSHTEKETPEKKAPTKSVTFNKSKGYSIASVKDYYLPNTGTPIVDTDASRTSTTGTMKDPALQQVDDATGETWQAPTEDIPL